MDWYAVLSVALALTLLIAIIDKLGKTIVLLEIVAFFGCFICLVMPVISYEIYNREFLLARIFSVYMHVPEDVYFPFALPAMAAFTMTICWPVKVNGQIAESNYFKKKFKEISLQLANMPYTGIQIVVVGIIMLYISALLPVSLNFVATLFYFASFAGLLYAYKGPSIAYKSLILIVIVLFTIGNALKSGMFTVLVYMSVTLISFFFIGNKSSFLKKTALFIAGIFLLILLQSVKGAFRAKTWNENYQGNRAALLQDLVSKQIDKSDFLSKKAFFPIYIRANQGINISRVMARIPARQPFDNGDYLFKTIASSFVPRFLWPDKPEAGGYYNMEHYAGIKIKNWSTNIGPLGEAYGNFGVAGGIAYMLLLGIMIRLAYKKVLLIAARIPLLLLWIPVLFYQIIFSMETDTLQILNSLIKSAFFIWLLSKILPNWFGLSKATTSHKSETPALSTSQ